MTAAKDAWAEDRARVSALLKAATALESAEADLAALAAQRAGFEQRVAPLQELLAVRPLAVKNSRGFPSCASCVARHVSRQPYAT